MHEVSPFFGSLFAAVGSIVLDAPRCSSRMIADGRKIGECLSAVKSGAPGRTLPTAANDLGAAQICGPQRAAVPAYLVILNVVKDLNPKDGVMAVMLYARKSP